MSGSNGPCVACGAHARHGGAHMRPPAFAGAPRASYYRPSPHGLIDRSQFRVLRQKGTERVSRMGPTDVRHERPHPHCPGLPPTHRLRAAPVCNCIASIRLWHPCTAWHPRTASTSMHNAEPAARSPSAPRLVAAIHRTASATSVRPPSPPKACPHSLMVPGPGTTAWAPPRRRAPPHPPRSQAHPPP